MKSIFRSLIISVVAILVTVGVANAVGVFYYDSVNDSFVIDGDLAVTGGGTLSGFFREINSAGNEHLYINSQEGINVQLTAGSRFGVNNSVNSRVFQVDNDGLLKFGSNLDNGRQGEPAVVNFQVDGKTGNIEIKGASTLTGGVEPTGVTPALAGSWLESIRLASPNSALITFANLGFGFSDNKQAVKGFSWIDTSNGPNGGSKYLMTLSSAGALEVMGVDGVSSNNFTLGSSTLTNWASIYTSGTYVKTNDVKALIKSQSELTFGGMFALSCGINTNPNPDVKFSRLLGRTLASGEQLCGPDTVNLLNENLVGCPQDFTPVTLISNTVYMPTVYYCYKQN